MTELECRKDRFRKATKAYYEEAERDYRRLNGFDCCHTSSCHTSSHEHERERVKEKESTNTEEREKTRIKRTAPSAVAAPNSNTFKRQRPRAMDHAANNKTMHMMGAAAAVAAKPVHKPELELELAHNMLESYYRIVELAIEEYLKSIRKFVLLVRQQRARTRAQVQVQVQVQEITGGRQYHNNNNNNNWEWIESRLQRHHAEAVEEQHIAMASAMVAVRETKITGEFAKQIRNCLDSVLIALRSVINSNSNSDSNNIPYIITITAIQPLPAAAIRKKEQHNMDIDSGGDHDDNNECAVWDRTVVEALKLDGYYRWFCKNNGVLIGNNKPSEKEEQEQETDGNNE